MLGVVVAALVPEQLASGSCGRSLCLGWMRIWAAGPVDTAAAAVDVAAAVVDNSDLAPSEVLLGACDDAAAVAEPVASRTTASDQSAAQQAALVARTVPARQVLESGTAGLPAGHHRSRVE